jgi:hypothetical protein
MQDIIIGISISATIGCLGGIIFGCALLQFKRQRDEAIDYTPIEKLKNALLTLALVTVNNDDMADLDLDYYAYNGKKYPPLSGSNLECACFSYIFNENYLKKSIMYSSNYASKKIAINKYLKMNLDTKEQVMNFFRKMCEKYKGDEENKGDKKD